MIFRSFFDIEFCIDFFVTLDAISAPFSMPFRPFGHYFGILFRCRIFLMIFGCHFGRLLGQIQFTGRSPERRFFHKKSCFFLGLDLASIFDGFWWFFGWILHGFSWNFDPFWSIGLRFFALFGSISFSYVSSLHFLPHQLFKPGASIFRSTFTTMKK